MTEKTNQCHDHSGLAGCAANLEAEINEKVWPTIRQMTPKWVFVLFGSMVIAFGLILINVNANAIAENKKEIQYLQLEIRAQLKEIKELVK